MFDSRVLETVVGIAFVFFAFSLVVSGINELIRKALATRSKVLWKSLKGMLEDTDLLSGKISVGYGDKDARPTAEGGGKAGFIHNEISLRVFNQIRGQRTRVDHITAGEFASAFIDVLTEPAARLGAIQRSLSEGIAAGVPLPDAAVDGMREVVEPVFAGVKTKVESLAAETKKPEVQKAVDKLLDKGQDLLGSVRDHITDTIPTELAGKIVEEMDKAAIRATQVIREAIPRLQLDSESAKWLRDTATGGLGAVENALATNRLQLPEGVKRRLDRMLIEATQVAAEHLEAFRRNIETWFDDSMERLTRWYRNRTRMVMAIYGLVVAVGLNVSAVHVAEALYENEDVRDAIVTMYDDQFPAPTDEDTSAGSDDSTAAENTGTEEATQTPDEALAELMRTALNTECVEDAAAGNGRLVECVEGVAGEIMGTELPLGWPMGSGGDVGFWALIVLGWLITAGAISLGAQFWFDTLKKISGLRK